MEVLKAILHDRRAYVTKIGIAHSASKLLAGSSGGIIPLPSLGDGQLHLYGFAHYGVGRGGGGTNPYSFFAKNIYVFHMIFQKFVFDSLEHTDHALNLIADSSFPGSLGLIVF